MADDDTDHPPEGSRRGDSANVISFADAKAVLAARRKKLNSELEQLIAKYNSRYAVVNANGTILVFEQKPDPMRPGCWLLHKYTFADFLKMNQNRRVRIMVSAPTVKDPDRYKEIFANAAQT